MKWRHILACFTLLVSFAVAANAQNKPEAQPAPRTREDAIKEQEAKTKAYDDGMAMGRKQHLKRQDKATQKRMKKNLRKAQKHSWGKDVPWYKRWFRKKKI
jgi:ABC-type protease/lipase transport system fused ATPase/permease subunit